MVLLSRGPDFCRRGVSAADAQDWRQSQPALPALARGAPVDKIQRDRVEVSRQLSEQKSEIICLQPWVVRVKG